MGFFSGSFKNATAQVVSGDATITGASLLDVTLNDNEWTTISVTNDSALTGVHNLWFYPGESSGGVAAEYFYIRRMRAVVGGDTGDTSVFIENDSGAAKFALPYDHYPSGTLRGILVEPAATNSITESQDFSAATIFGTDSITVTSGAATGPDGVSSSADELAITDTTSEAHGWWYLRSDQVLKLPFDFTRMFEDAESNGLSTRFIDDNPFESDLLRYSDSGESKALVVASGNGRKAWFWSWRHASQKAANTSALKLCESQKSQHGVHTGECQLYAVGTVTVTPELRGKCLPGLELSDRIRHYEGSHQSELSVQVDEASVGLPAYEAGIRAGDLLSAIDGKVVTNASFVTNYFNVGCPDSVEVSYRRPARIPEIHMAPSIREHGCEIGLRTQEVGGLILEDAEIRNGVLVQEVMPGTAAARAGIVPGDIIVELDGSKGVNSWGFSSYIAEKCGTPVSISVLRYADPVTVGVTPLRFR
jgi:hypothetical protein